MIEWTSKGLVLKLSFAYPLTISTGQVNDEFELQVTELGPKNFVSAENFN